MLLLISACNIPWWALLLGLIVPAILAWILRGVFMYDASLELQRKVENLEAELKRCYEEKMRITTTQVSPKVKFTDMKHEVDSVDRSEKSSSIGTQTGKNKSNKSVREKPSSPTKKSSSTAKKAASTASSKARSKSKSSSPKESTIKSPPRQSNLKDDVSFKSPESKAIRSNKKAGKSVGATRKKTTSSILKTTGIGPFPKLQDNLQVCEGIGPKMEEILNENGIKTWATLGATTPKQLRGILRKYGDRYRIIEPKEWPKQARLLAKGEWERLIKFQYRLGGSKEGNSAAKAAKLLSKYGYNLAYKKDDLKVIEGIGPKIAELLIAADISTWDKLSKTSTDTLNDILGSAGKRFALAKPDSWPVQAKLAAEGDFKGLEQLQSKLKGGR